MIVEEDGVYELRAVPTTSISLVTDCVIKVRASAIDAPLIYMFLTQVDIDEIVERHRKSKMMDAIKSLSGILQDWLTFRSTIPEVDWSKIRLLDFQETLQQRNTIVKWNSNRECSQCPDFTPHVRVLFTTSDKSVHHAIVHYHP